MITTTVFVDHRDLALVPTIRQLPEADIEAVAHAGTAPERDGHYFVVRTANFAAFERSLDADHTVASYAAVDGSGDARTYRVVYSESATLVTPSMTEVGGLVLRSWNRDTGWALELQLRDRDALRDVDRFAQDHDVHVEVLEIRQTDGDGYDVDAGTEFSLTEPQIEALVAAYANGYYDEDQDVTLAELSELLGISESAVSGRLRRGAARLVEATLVDEDEQ
ncbi:helix-turn-helix domain-containing protein [Halobacterium yunchengense]|uniref:helix-turn-helix domain-containing protein n=1 Tax=Halobacterium yunchengense TaxID=3108497 RepID=UPI0030089A59